MRHNNGSRALKSYFCALKSHRFERSSQKIHRGFARNFSVVTWPGCRRKRLRGDARAICLGRSHAQPSESIVFFHVKRKSDVLRSRTEQREIEEPRSEEHTSE